MQVELCEIPLAGAPLPPPKRLPAARGFGRRGYAQAGRGVFEQPVRASELFLGEG